MLRDLFVFSLYSFPVPLHSWDLSTSWVILGYPPSSLNLKYHGQVLLSTPMIMYHTAKEKNVSGKLLTGSEPCTGMDGLCKWEPVDTILQICSVLIIKEGHSRGNSPVISSMFYSWSGYSPTKKKVLVRKHLPLLKIMTVACSTTLKTGEKKPYTMI